MDRLYDAIGGLPALEVAVNRFCARVRSDMEVAEFFVWVDLHHKNPTCSPTSVKFSVARHDIPAQRYAGITRFCRSGSASLNWWWTISSPHFKSSESTTLSSRP